MMSYLGKIMSRNWTLAFSFALFALFSGAAWTAEIGRTHRVAIEELIDGRLIATTTIVGVAAGLSGGPAGTADDKRRAAYVAAHLDVNMVYEELIRLYAANFTEHQAKEINAFFKTPAGTKWRLQARKFASMVGEGKSPMEAQQATAGMLSNEDLAAIRNFLTQTPSGKLLTSATPGIHKEMQVYLTPTIKSLMREADAPGK
jgi:hypothetical protein